jgi:hypothetical protein
MYEGREVYDVGGKESSYISTEFAGFIVRGFNHQYIL